MESVKLLCSKFTAHLGAAHTLILFLINTFKENKLNGSAHSVLIQSFRLLQSFGDA